VKVFLALAPLFGIPCLPACTTEQAYGTGQAWQRNQCSRLPDKTDYDRCMSRTNTDYESYRRQRESGQK
jgi:hypothetical protein